MITFDEVQARLLERVRDLSASPAQFSSLEKAILIQSGRLSLREHHASFRLPLLIYTAIRGDDRPALDLAAAMLLMFMGTDLLDDLADGDVSPDWAGEDSEQIRLLAIGMFATMPQLILTHLDAPDSTLIALQRALLVGSAQMGAGQRLDMLSRQYRESEEMLTAAWECVEGKSGAAIALLGRLAALLAGAPHLADTCANLGHAVGCSICLIKDCIDLSKGAHSSDLANGTLTYPIALYVTGLKPEARRDFLNLLSEARTDPAKREEAYRRMSTTGSLAVIRVVIESCKAKALAALTELNPPQPTASFLRDFIGFRQAGATAPAGR